jgi:hypothetical protein
LDIRIARNATGARARIESLPSPAPSPGTRNFDPEGLLIF